MLPAYFIQTFFCLAILSEKILITPQPFETLKPCYDHKKALTSFECPNELLNAHIISCQVEISRANLPNYKLSMIDLKLAEIFIPGEPFWNIFSNNLSLIQFIILSGNWQIF